MTASWVPFAQIWVTVGTVGAMGLLWWLLPREARRLRAARPAPVVGLWVMGRRP